MNKKSIASDSHKKTTAPSVPRRDAMKLLAGAGAAFSIVPSHVLGDGTATAPSDKINMALIGAGNRGPADIGGAVQTR